MSGTTPAGVHPVSFSKVRTASSAEEGSLGAAGRTMSKNLPARVRAVGAMVAIGPSYARTAATIARSRSDMVAPKISR